MDNDVFLKRLRGVHGWKDLLGKGKAGVSVDYKGVTFLLYRDDASHFLRYVPMNKTEVKIIGEFNNLMESCRKDIMEEMVEWNDIRLERDDNEGD